MLLQTYNLLQTYTIYFVDINIKNIKNLNAFLGLKAF